MKHALPLLIILIIAANIAFGAHWHRIPIDINQDFTGLHFFDKNTGFLVTKNGQIISIDLTVSPPRIKTTSFPTNFYDICFLNNGRVGFAVGDKGLIAKTQNAGLDWTTISHHPDMRFTGIRFVDSISGYMVGSSYGKKIIDTGFVFETSNGGETWDSLTIRGRKIRKVDISNDSLITVTGFGAIYKLDKRTETWDTVKLDFNMLPMATTIRDNKGIIVGGRGLLALSSDRGRTWELTGAIVDTATFFDILMLDSKRAYIVGTGGEILYTGDSGRNWTPEASTTGFDLNAVHLAGNRIFVCGKKGTLIYTDLEK